MMIPVAPFSQFVGGALMLAGGLMQLFGEKEPSEEM